jgi:hypothetical protein
MVVLVLCARLERRGGGLIEERKKEWKLKLNKVKAGMQETETPRLSFRFKTGKKKAISQQNKVGAIEEFAGACHQRTLL